MDATSIIAGVFGGFLGALIVNYFTKSWDFKYDYKKYILDKRKTAYDEVAKILALLSKEGTVSQHLTYNAIFEDPSAFWGTKEKIHDVTICIEFG